MLASLPAAARLLAVAAVAPAAVVAVARLPGALTLPPALLALMALRLVPRRRRLGVRARLESLDGVEKRSVMVSDWATCEMKGRFEYDPATGAVSDHAPPSARAGHARALTSIAGGKARDGR